MNLLDFIWDVEKPLDLLPELVRKEFISMAKELKEQTKVFYNSTCLITSQKPNMYKCRVSENKNPKWYSEIYYSSNKTSRKHILKALDQIIDEKDKKLISCTQKRFFWTKLKKKRIVESKKGRIIFDKGDVIKEKRVIENYKNIFHTRFRELIYKILVEGYEFETHYQPSNGLVRTYFGKYEPGEKKELQSLERIFEFYQPINETEQFSFEKEYHSLEKPDILKKLKFAELNYFPCIWNFYDRIAAKEPKQEF